jgi:HAD superfamily hydrolase (TIGR01509 family)
MSLIPPHVTTILFDVGNTLHHIDHEFIATVIGRHGHPTTGRRVNEVEYAAKASVDAQVRAARSGTDATRAVSYFEVIMNELGVAEEVREAIATELRAENQRDSLWRVMHPDTPDVLRQLGERGFTLGVVSNADGRVPAALAARGLAPHFRVIIDSHLVGVEKPDPRIFRMALEQCGASPAEAIYVGDIYEIDVQGSRAVGMTPILIDPLGRYGDVDCLRIDGLTRLLEL